MPTVLTWPLAPGAPSVVPGSAASPSGYGSAVAVAQVNYGTDWNTFPDLDFAPISGLEAVAQALVRSLMDADQGVDISDWLNDDLGAAQVYDLQQTIAAQCVADERVSTAEVVVTQLDLLALSIDIAVTPSNGVRPFRLVLSVDQLAVKVLSLEASP